MKNKKGFSVFKGKVKSYFKNAKLIDYIIMGGIALAVTVVIVLAVMLIGGTKKPSISQTSSQGNDSASNSSASYDKNAVSIDKKEFTGTVLEETKDAGTDYLDNTLFIGDSNTTRTMFYGVSTLKNNVSAVSMGIQHVTTTPIVFFTDRESASTVPQAVKIIQPQRILITYGTNNTVGWSSETFITEYKKALDAIVKAYPYADIIVNAIPPIDKQRDNPLVTMKTIDEFNSALAKMAKAEGYKFLNSAEALKDEKTGYAKKDYTISDGFHLSKAGNEALSEYIRTHSYITEDRRPKPLKAIPGRKETPPQIISNDGTIVRGQSKGVQVNFVSSDKEFGSIDGSTSQEVKYGGECSTVTAVPKEGYQFNGWSCSEGVISDTSAAAITFGVPSILTDKTVTVTAHFIKKVAKVTLSFVNGKGEAITAFSLQQGSSADLAVSVNPSTDVKLAFTSSNEGVASVNSAGTLTAVAEGQATITCSAGESAKAALTVTVTKKEAVLSDFVISQTTATLDIGGSFKLSISTITPADARITAKSYTSSNPSVASVDDAGNITAISGGSATITCTLNNISKSCVVTVNPAAVTPPTSQPSTGDDSTVTPPPSGGSTVPPPPSGGSTVPPPSGGSVAPPTSGGSNAIPPPSGGSIVAP